MARHPAWRDLNDALLEFYGPGLDASSYVERTFTLTSRLLPFALNSHGVIDAQTHVLAANFDRSLPGLDVAFEAFGRLMGKHAPFRFDPKLNDGKPFSARDFYSQREFNDLDIAQEVYRPMRFVDHCFVHVPSIDGSTVFAGFMRDGRAFDDTEKEVLRAVQPHLANGRVLASALSAAKEQPLQAETFSRAGFTPRECDVLFWLTQGKSNADIAMLMNMRSDSVHRHLRTICEKLGVEHRSAAAIEAIALARRLQSVPPAVSGGVALRVATRVTA
jgi:DNA-binding CsgD family transcriptional regulator